MAENPRLFERVELFTRATSDAFNKAIGDVLDAKGPWQLLYRLSRIVLLGLVPGNQTVVGVAMARVLGHMALGLCESEQPEALPIPQALPPGSDLLICPIGCTASGGSAKGASGGLLLAVFERPSAAAPSSQGATGTGSDTGASTVERLQRRQREQLMLISRHLGELLWSRGG